MIMTPQGMTNPTMIAERLKPYAKLEGKPILASWMGGVEAAGGEDILNHAGIPTFPYPDTASSDEGQWRCEIVSRCAVGSQRRAFHSSNAAIVTRNTPTSTAGSTLRLINSTSVPPRAQPT